MIAIIAINRPLNKVLITWWVKISLAADCVTRVAVYSSTNIQKNKPLGEIKLAIGQEWPLILGDR